MTAPNSQVSATPAVLSGGDSGAIIDSNNTLGNPAAVIDGDLIVLGSVTSSGPAFQSGVVTMDDGVASVTSSLFTNYSECQVFLTVQSNDAADFPFCAGSSGAGTFDIATTSGDASTVAWLVVKNS
jgi:hypothetical protein